jgi:hypothetical protein
MLQASTTVQCGAPHFKSIAKNHRHANYNLEKAINEFIDNIIKLATKIHITTEVDSEGRLQELKVSDNYVFGFININEEGINNPFNMGHIKSGHDDDNETSEFGCGGKAAALSASNHLAVVTKTAEHYYEVICDFIKMQREEDVIASYNPKKREILEADYRDIHPFETGSSIILTKILGTICEQTTQQKLTKRIKKGISETYSRFFKDGMEILVNGEPVEREIDFFLDNKCIPFTVRKELVILEKQSTNDKIFLIQKTVERTTWQIYNKLDDTWEAFKSVKEADDFRDSKRKEGYTYYCKSLNGFDNSCVKIESTFVCYSDLIHTDEEYEYLLPQDQVLIYKDNRKYGKKSFVKHNNGSHNYTLHKIEFSSKKIGKELGITFNKEITMDSTNDLVLSLKSAIKDNRKEFNADTSSEKNRKLCEKAIKLGIINMMSCKKDKLSTFHRDKRMQEENKYIAQKNPSFKPPSKPKPVPQPPVIKHVPKAFQSDDESSDYSSSDESTNSNGSTNSNESTNSNGSISSKGSANSKELTNSNGSNNSNELTNSNGSNNSNGSEVTTGSKDEPKSLNETDSETNNVSQNLLSMSSQSIGMEDNDLEKSKTILINISKIIMDITATDDFNVKLENSIHILDVVQKMLNL